MSKYVSLKDAKSITGASYKTIKRYVDKGELRQKTLGKKTSYHIDDIRAITSKLQKNRAIHRPDTIKESVVIHTPKEMMSMMDKEVDPSILLDEYGTQELMNVSKQLEENGLLEITNKTIIMKYAMLQMMWFKYFIAATDNLEYLKIAEAYQKQVQFYEKELGLTPASLARIKPHEKENEGKIDPMEELLK